MDVEIHSVDHQDPVELQAVEVEEEFEAVEA
jgi:hypothetical protein